MNEKHPAQGHGEARDPSPDRPEDTRPDTDAGATGDAPHRKVETARPARTGDPDATGAEAESRPPGRRGGGVLAAFALLIALAAAAAAGWVWWTQEQSLAGADAGQADLRGDIAALGRRQDGLQESLDDLARRVQQQQDRDAALRDDLSSLAQQLRANESALKQLQAGPGAGPDWRLAEIGHLLRVAQRELALADNVGIALAALEAADRRAAAIGDGALTRLRQQLSEDIVALRAVPRPDLDGMALRLGSMAAKVDDLPLAGQQRGAIGTGEAEAEPEGGLARLRAKIAGLFRNIFQVRRTEEEAVPFIAPESEFFLRRNLELQLETARLALLSGEQGVYQESLRTARRWVREYFETSDPAVQRFLDMTGELEGRPVRTEYPDLSRSLAILEGLRATAEARE